MEASKRVGEIAVSWKCDRFLSHRQMQDKPFKNLSTLIHLSTRYFSSSVSVSASPLQPQALFGRFYSMYLLHVVFYLNNKTFYVFGYYMSTVCTRVGYAYPLVA